MATRLLIVDDYRVFGQGLEAVFSAEPEFEAIAVGSLDQVPGMVAAYRPDVVIMDVRLGEANGIDLTRELLAASCRAAVIILTAYADVATMISAIQAGAAGFLAKDAPVEQVISAVRAVLSGGTWLPRDLLRSLIAAHPPPAEAPQRRLIADLSPSEREVLSLLVSGVDRRDIACRLRMSPNTVRTHVRNISVKLACHGALEAVAIALKAGMRPVVTTAVGLAAPAGRSRSMSPALPRHSDG
jgi:DNA-binding NarL/FixJ family response regulator